MVRVIGKRSVECPHCLFGSGIVANGKGSTCSVCGGRGTVSKKKYNEYIELLKK